MLAEVDQNQDTCKGFTPYTGKDCKDLVEEYLEEIYRAIGIDIPEKHEDITQFCYEDVMAAADPDNWHKGGVQIAFRRFIEAKNINN